MIIHREIPRKILLSHENLPLSWSIPARSAEFPPHDP